MLIEGFASNCFLLWQRAAFEAAIFRRGLLRNQGLTGVFPSDNLIPSPFRTLSIMSSITLLLRVRAKAWAGRAAIVLGELSSLRPSAGIRRTISTAVRERWSQEKVDSSYER